MRTFHYGGTASRVSEQSQRHANPGRVKYLNVNTVKSKSGELVVVNRSGKLVISDSNNRELERYALTYGSHLAVAEGAEVNLPGQELVNWDPFTSAVLTEIAGAVEFQDVVEGENVREDTDKVTGLSQRIIVEAQLSEKRSPAVLIRGKGAERKYMLPTALTWSCRTDRRSIPAMSW